MTKVIDERVVQMSFDNADFEKDAKKSSKTLERLDTRINNTGASADLSKLTNAVSGVSNRFTALGTIATGALLSIGAKAVQLGENLVRSIAIEPVSQGWQEYELKINSIKTMLASGKTREGLPVTLEMVNEELEALNEYSDQTIYSFADMTQNIGKFTNAGVALPDAVQSIKGIANAAALSGASSEEASRAMYNFAQALSAGYVKLIDWKSIENANMATVEFKQQLLDSAVAAGTLEKQADGMYKVLTTNASGSTMGQTIDATTNFNDSLQYQWMTSQALNDTLADYADETTEIGKKASDAATKVRTFTQLMDTTKEAVGSGWAKTFELIVGDYDQATELYTSLSETFGRLVQISSDFRNGIIEDVFAQWGGRQNILIVIQDVIEAVKEASRPITQAFQNIFGTNTPMASKIADSISSFIVKIQELTENLDFSRDTLYKMRTIFEGFFSIFWIGKEALKYFVAAPLKKIFEEFSNFLPEGDTLLDKAAYVGKFFKDLRYSIKDTGSFSEASKKIIESIGNFFEKLKGYGSTVSDSTFVSKLKAKVEDIKLLFSYFFTKDDTSDTPKESYITRITAKIKESLDPLIKYMDKIKPQLESVKEWFSPIWDELTTMFKTNWQTTTFTDVLAFLETFVNLLFTGGLVVGLSSLLKSFSNIGDSISGMFGGVTGILDGIKNTLTSYQTSLKAQTLKEIAISIGILAVSLIALSLIDGERLKKATLYISILFVELSASLLLFEKTISGHKLPAITLGLVGLSAAMLGLVGSVSILSMINSEKLQNGVTAIGVLLGLINGFVFGMSKISGRSLIATGLALNIMAVAMTGLVGVVYLLGSMDADKIQQGLISIGVLFSEVAAFSVVIGKTMSSAELLSSSALLLAIGQSLVEISSVVDGFGKMNPETLKQGLFALGAVITGLVAATKLMGLGGGLTGAVSILALTGAITILTPALIALGSVPFSVILEGLVALAGVFAIIGGASYLLAPLLPAMLGLAAGILAIGVSIGAIGLGIGAAAFGIALLLTSFIALSKLDNKAIDVMMYSLERFITLIPYLGTKLAEAIIKFAVVIREGSPVIAAAIVSVMKEWVGLLVEHIPELVKALFTFITSFLTEVRKSFPEWVELGVEMLRELLAGLKLNLPQIQRDTQDIIASFLSGLADGLPEMAKAGADLIVAYLQSISDESPRIVDQAFKTLITFTNGFSDAVRENTPALIDAGTNMMTAFVDGVMIYLGIADGTSEEGKKISKSVITGLVAGLNPLAAVTQMLTVAKDMVSAIKEYFGIESPATLFIEIAKNLIAGFVNGLIEDAKLVAEEWIPILEGAVDTVTMYKDRFLIVGENLVESIIEGISNKFTAFTDKVEELGEAALNTIGFVWDMHSPSKKFMGAGENAGTSLANGIVSTIRHVSRSIKVVADKAVSDVSDTSSKIASALARDFDTAPTIRPVVDLSLISEGAKQASTFLNQHGSYGLAMAASTTINKKNGQSNQNGSTPRDPKGDLVIHNNFDLTGLTVRSEVDIENIAKKLKELQDTSVRGRGMKTFAYNL